MKYVEKYLSNKGVRGGNLSDYTWPSCFLLLYSTATSSCLVMVLLSLAAAQVLSVLTEQGTCWYGDDSVAQAEHQLRCYDTDILTLGDDLTTCVPNYNERN